MGTARRWVARGAMLALIAGLLVPGMATAAPVTVEVQIGAPLFEHPDAGGAPADGMRFYAPTTKVHAGDTVVFNFAGFHTATLLPANTDVHGWAADNAGGTTKPFSLLISDPDDGADAVKANPAAAFGDPTCGTAANPCAYDGTGVVNSGLPFSDPPVFAATINAAPGDVVWVVCLVHPHMRMRIKVVGEAEATTSQADIDAFRDAKTALDAEDAGVAHDRLADKQTKHRTADGKVVWDAYAGFDGHHWALMDMYPHKLVVRKGQNVRWHFSQLINEDHTVSLPFAKTSRVWEDTFVPQCDPDGDAGPGPDGPPELPGPPFCTDPTQFEVDIPGKAFSERGDGVFNGDYQNSGFRGPGLDNLDSYDVKFKQRSGRAGFRYFCLIHGPQMDGRVRVKRAS